MPSPDDDLMAEFDAEAEAQAPRMRSTVRTVLDPVDVVGAADGSGTSTMGAGGRYVFGEEVDANAPIEAVPKGPAEAPSAEVGSQLEAAARARAERERRIAAAREVTPTGIVDSVVSPVWDALVAGGTMQTPGRQSPEARRTGERLAQVWDQLTASDARFGGRNTIDPIVGQDERGDAPLRGARSALTLGFDDELTGAADALLGRDEYRVSRDRERTRSARAAEQAPAAHAIGQVAGTLPMFALPGGSQANAAVRGAAAGSAVSLPWRLAMAAGQGAQLGGMNALGGSDADLMDAPLDVAQDAAIGAGLGGAMGFLGEAGGALIGAAGHGPTPNGRARDEALLAATGHAGNNRSAIDAFDFGNTPTQVQASHARAAQVLRDTHAVPAMGGMHATEQQINAALDGTRRTMDDVRTAMGARGPTGSEISQRLRDRARAIREVAAEPQRVLLEDMAARFGDDTLAGARPSTEPLTYDAIMAEANALRAAGAWRTRGGDPVDLNEEARRIVDREVRGAYDDAIEAQLAGRGPGGSYRGGAMSHEQTQAAARLGDSPVDAYRTARQQYAVLRTAADNAKRGVAATAGNRTFGLSELQWAGTGASIFGGAAAPLGPIVSAAAGTFGAAVGTGASRVWRAVEPRARAAASNLVYDFARQYPRELMSRLPLRTARQLAESASRGPAAFATTLNVLAQRDAEVRRLMQEFDEGATPEAVRAIGASGEQQ